MSSRGHASDKMKYVPDSLRWRAYSDRMLKYIQLDILYGYL